MLEECRISSIQFGEECVDGFNIMFCGVEWKKRCIEVAFLFSKVVNGIGDRILWRKGRIIVLVVDGF